MIKVGIAGSGFGLYGLLPAFNSTTGCKVVCICGKKTQRLISYCKKISLRKIYADWQTMLEEEKLDAIAIAVTPSTQYQIAKAAISKNLHIFAEKPLATTFNQAKELLNLAKKKKIITAVDFIFPEIEAWKKVKKMIDKKTYGKLEHLDLNWDFLSHDIKNKKSSWKTDTALGGGALSFYFSHSLYYLEYFAGKISEFKSRLSYSRESINGGEIGIDLILKFENNVTGKAHLNCNNKKLTRHQLIFTCEKARIVLENKNFITSNFEITIYINGKIEKLIIPETESLKNNIDERVIIVKKIVTKFINGIIHKKETTPSFKEGLRVQKLIEEIKINNNG